MEDFQELLKEKRRNTATVWATFRDTFEVEIEYIERRGLRRIIKKASKKGWVNHQAVDEIDDNRMAEELSALIRNWRGLTPEVLGQILPIDISGLDPKKEFPCTDTNKIVLLKEAYDFDLFVQRTCTDLANFQEEKRQKDLGE